MKKAQGSINKYMKNGLMLGIFSKLELIRRVGKIEVKICHRPVTMNVLP